MRHRSRHLHATLVDQAVAGLTRLGWMSSPVVFGADMITVIDYQPERRIEPIEKNTVAVTIGDVPGDIDGELGAYYGGLRTCVYPVFIDVYMAEPSLSIAVCDDLRDIFDLTKAQVVDHAAGVPDDSVTYEVDRVMGPEEPSAAATADAFKKNWRVMKLEVTLAYST